MKRRFKFLGRRREFITLLGGGAGVKGPCVSFPV
jgi:hypothetical protein